MAAESALFEGKNRVLYLEIGTKSYVGACSGARRLFDWTVNPYRGCEYGCKYCYARYTHEFMELPVTEFETRIFAKRWDAAAFRRELTRLKSGQSIAFGTATDCYQPAERRFGLMRRMLTEMSKSLEGLKILVTTKSDLVARDAALLGALARRNDVRISFTITTLDDSLARKLEPYAPRPALRLQALRRLADRGVAVGVGMSPLLPRITDSEAAIGQVAAAAKAAGARTFWAQPLFLKSCARQVFLPWLEREYPALYGKYHSWYSREAYLDKQYVEFVAARVARARETNGLSERVGDYRPPDWEGSAQLQLFA